MKGSLANDQLVKAQAKITYLGPQSKPIPTVVFAVKGHKVSMIRFVSVQRSPKPYENDELPYTKFFEVTADEFRRMLEAAINVIGTGGSTEAEFLAFTYVTGAGASASGKEYLIPHSRGKQFYTALLSSLASGSVEAKLILEQSFKNAYPPD